MDDLYVFRQNICVHRHICSKNGQVFLYTYFLHLIQIIPHNKGTSKFLQAFLYNELYVSIEALLEQQEILLLGVSGSVFLNQH